MGTIMGCCGRPAALRRPPPPAPAGRREPPSPSGRCPQLVRRARVGRPRLVEIVDLEHQLDRGDAADRVGREHAEAQGDRAHQLAVDVDRAAAHAAGDVGADCLAAHLGEDDVLLRPPGVLPQADDFHRHRLGFVPVNTVQAVPFIPGLIWTTGMICNLSPTLGRTERGVRRIQGKGDRRDESRHHGRSMVHGVNSSAGIHCTMRHRSQRVKLFISCKYIYLDARGARKVRTAFIK